MKIGKVNITLRSFLTGIAVLAIFIVFRLYAVSGQVSREDLDYKRYFLSHYKIFSATIPANLTFAGEPVPLNDFTVYENMDRELTSNLYFQSNSILIFKRTSRWFPVIEPILKKNGIPEDFKYVPLIESGLTNAISPKGATGFWQIMDVAAQNFGLEVSEEVDERYNVEKATEASCRFFKESYERFHDWTLVLASFNYGIEGLQKVMDEQKEKKYYDLLLNEETTRYIFRLLALKELVSNPKNYGYLVRKKDLYPPIRTYKVSVDSAISDMVGFAKHFNLSYKMLKYFNPWLRKDHLTNASGKKYEITIPRQGYNENYFDDLSDYEKKMSGDDSLTYFTPVDTAKK
ncbi:MAG TPA: lytic transglycosylase domain-containing protein [Bacteroidia bacterium]|jgi:hypothetical protein